MKTLNTNRNFMTARPSSGLQLRDASSEAPTQIIELAEMKIFLRIDHDVDDELIKKLIDAVTMKAEAYKGQSFRKRTFIAYWENFGDFAELPMGPHRSITKVEIKQSNQWVEMDAGTYAITGDKKLKISFLSTTASLAGINTSFTTLGFVMSEIRVTFESGYREPEEEQEEGIVKIELPKQVVAAIQDSIAFLYENRGELQVEKGKAIEGALTPTAKSMLDSIGR